MLWQALTLQLGYNATLVTLGAMLLGLSAGVSGTFLFLRRRSLVSDAISHATLPGVGLAFITMVALGGDGRSLAGLLLGSALSAALGLAAVQWLSHRTRLAEDSAIGAILSVFFGFGIVLLTVIQTMESGRQAGLSGLLLGSTAGMLRADANLIVVGGALTLTLTLILRRPMIAVAFDEGYAASRGLNIRAVDFATMALVLAVTVVGLKVVGLILIVALLIIPPVAARFWSDRTERVWQLSGLIGGLSGYIGAALSASAPDLPTGPIIVLTAFSVFATSLILAPNRGVLAAGLRQLAFRRRLHKRQGLLALAQGQPIHEAYTLRLLRRAGLTSADGVATDLGRVRAAITQLDETRWAILRAMPNQEAAASLYDGLRPIESVVTRDQIAAIDTEIERPAGGTS